MIRSTAHPRPCTGFRLVSIAAAALLGAFVPLANAFTVSPSNVSIVAARGVNHLPLTVPVTYSPSVNLANVRCTSDADWVAATVDSVSGALQLTFSSGGLVNASSTATLTLTDGTGSGTVTIAATMAPLNLTALVADPTRSRAYGLHQNGVNAGALVVYDPLHETFVGSLSVGEKPADLAISADGAEMLVICSAAKKIYVIDLAALAVKEVLALPSYVDWGVNDTSAHVAYGPGNIIYYTDGGWAPSLYVFDRATQMVKQKLTTISSQDSFGFGDFVLTADRAALFCWGQYGWTAGSASSAAAKYSVGRDGTLTFVARMGASYPNGLMRDPLNTPAMVSSDGLTAVVKQYVLNAADITDIRQQLPMPAFAISPGAEIACTQSAVYQVSTGNKVLDLPVTTQVQAITFDYSRLVYFNANTRAIGTVNLTTALTAAVLGLQRTPANGAIVLSPAELKWTPILGVNRYRVYLGTSAEAVRLATTASPEYRGEVTTNQYTLSEPLAAGTRYYWRIDPVTANDLAVGQVNEFTVSTIATSSSAINTATVQPHRRLVVPLQLTGAAAPVAWLAASPVQWITFGATTGTTPATLAVIMDASQLAPGVHETSIQITTPQGPIAIPVKLQVDPLALTVIRTDPGSRFLYATSEVTSEVSPRAYLLEIDASAGAVTRVVRVGTSATDLAIHHPDNRIYVPNWAKGELLAVNLESFAVERSYPFLPAAGAYGRGDVYRVSAGGPGRLMVEAEDQWVDLGIFDTARGVYLAKSSVREGGGAYGSDRRYYFHGDNNNSDASLRKYDTMGDVLTLVGSARPASIANYYGSRTVVMAENGSRIFWNGVVFTPDLGLDWLTPDLICSASADGRFAFGERRIFDVVRHEAVLGMPVATTVSAYNSVAGKLVVQKGNRLGFYTVDPSAALPTPWLWVSAVGSSSVGLSWMQDGLQTKFTLQYQISGASEWIDVGGVLGTDVSRSIGGLLPNTVYNFRMKADSPQSSSAWSAIATIRTLPNTPTYLSIIRQPSNRTVAMGAPASFSVLVFGTGTLTYAWQASSDGTAWTPIQDGADYAGTRTATLTVNHAPLQSQGTRYRCEVTNNAGTAITEAATLGVMRSAGTSVDLDGDGRMEAVWRHAGTQELGSWTAAGGYVRVGQEGSGYEVMGYGDFDADGRTEAVWRHIGTGALVTWSSAGQYLQLGTEGSTWQVLGLGDFDGDGKTEFLWRHAVTAEIATWTMAGGFIQFGSESSGWQVIGVGDFDGDGKSEPLTRNSSTGEVATTTRQGTLIRLGVEGGGWEVLGVGDFDGDGKTEPYWRDNNRRDIVAYTMSGLGLWLGNEGSGWSVIGAGDYDADSCTEPLWRNNATGEVGTWTMAGSYLRLGVEANGWEVVPKKPAIRTQPAAQRIASGHNATFTIEVAANPTPILQWQVSSDGGTWADVVDGAEYSGAGTASLTIANASHALDGHQYRCVVRNAAGRATTAAATLNVSARACVANDLDGDGKTDLLWKYAPLQELGVWNSTGFVHLGTEGTGWVVIGVGDFDGDGRMELIWRHTGSGQVATWPSGGGYVPLGTESAWQVIRIGDFDGDGRSELLWRHSGTGQVVTWTQAGAYLELGAETDGWRVIGIADFDGDGRQEPAWRNTNSSAIRTTTIAGATVPLGTEGGGWTVTAFGDIDGDGRAEPFWRHASTLENVTWTRAGGFVRLGSESSQGWHVIAVGDYDGDGKSEPLWQHETTRELATWPSGGGYLPLGTESGNWTIGAPGS
jgi:hypothetical protein